MKAAKALIIPEVNRRREEQSSESNAAKKPEDFLQWMMDSAETDFERQPSTLAHLQLVLTIASLHTTNMAIIQTLYDLCAYPEYISLLREEIEMVLAEDGKWTKESYTKLRKLDSFMKESQRMNAAGLSEHPR